MTRKRKGAEVEDGIDTLLRVAVVMARHDDDRVRGLATIVEAAARGLQHETIAESLTKPAGVAELCRRILADHERAHGLLAEQGEGVALLHAPPRDSRKAAAVALREQVRQVRVAMLATEPHGAIVDALTDLLLSALQGSPYAPLRPASMPSPTSPGFASMRDAVRSAIDRVLMSPAASPDESIVRCALRAAGLPDRVVRNLYRT